MKTITELVSSLVDAFFKKKYAAPIEDGSTPSTSYAVGDLLMHGGQLCKVTSALTPSTVMVIGTNLEVTTIAQGMGSASKMNTDGSNADSHVTFNGAFTAGGRVSGSSVGTNSMVQGAQNTASGNYSHAEGNYTEASGASAHAEGCGTSTDVNEASGIGSHAEGGCTKAQYDYSHAEGYHTKTGAPNQLVAGKYNRGDADSLFEVGNGLTENSRSNAFAVYGDGISTDNGANRVLLQELAKKGTYNATDPVTARSGRYTFHINNTAASTAVAWCNKIARVSFGDNPIAEGAPCTVFIQIHVADHISYFYRTLVPNITSITLYDKATAKQTITSTSQNPNFMYQIQILEDENYDILLAFIITPSFMTSAVVTALQAVKSSLSPGFSCVYAANSMEFTGTVYSTYGIQDSVPRLNPYVYGGIIDPNNPFNIVQSAFNYVVGDFYLPTGGPRWNLEVEVECGTAYYAICYLENTTTGAYFNHSICYVGVPSVTFAAPTVAPAPVAGKVIAFVGTTWTPFVAGVAGVVEDHGTYMTYTTKPRLRIQGYHSSNTPTAGLGMHIRLIRIY